MRLSAITPREASIFACLADAVIAPEPVLPAIRDTDAVAFFDRWLARSPRQSRVALRALLYALEVAPLAYGFRTRLRRLDRAQRTDWLAQLRRPPQIRFVTDYVKAAAQLSYYGSDIVMTRLGYDPATNLERAHELRRRDGRP